jgi:hypothetical protein
MIASSPNLNSPPTVSPFSFDAKADADTGFMEDETPVNTIVEVVMVSRKERLPDCTSTSIEPIEPLLLLLLTFPEKASDEVVRRIRRSGIRLSL